MSLPRGISNNNFDNIRWGRRWQGSAHESEKADQIFCQFVDPIAGVRAVVKVLFTYRDKYGLKTVKSMINRYARPNENNTQGYIQRVCTKLGVQQDEPVELTDEVLYWVIKVIYGVDNGNDYSNYPPREVVEQAIKLARS